MQAPASESLLAAVGLGLLGSLHCVGMCGGIASALGVGAAKRRPLERLGAQLGYSLGRISTYVLAGGVVGGLGVSLRAAAGPGASVALRLLAGAFLVAAGLYLGEWWLGLGRLEAWMSIPWRRISRLGRVLLPADRSWKLWLLGLVWGCLPCGLVYAALAGAGAAGGWRRGALWMLCFGLGTLPAMLVVGTLGGRLPGRVRGKAARRLGATLITLFGLWTVAAALMMAWLAHRTST